MKEDEEKKCKPEIPLFLLMEFDRVRMRIIHSGANLRNIKIVSKKRGR